MKLSSTPYTNAVLVQK